MISHAQCGGNTVPHRSFQRVDAERRVGMSRVRAHGRVLGRADRSRAVNPRVRPEPAARSWIDLTQTADIPTLPDKGSSRLKSALPL